MRLVIAAAMFLQLTFCAYCGEKKEKKPPPPPPAPAPIEQTVTVGKGGYLVQAKDKLPAAAFVTERVHGPLPSNDWCTSVYWQPFSSNHFAHPLAMRCDKAGLRIGYPDVKAKATAIESGFGEGDLTIGHSDETAFPDARVDGQSDWFLRVEFKNGDKLLHTTYGHGSPFVFVRTQGGNPALRFTAAPAIWQGKAGDAVLGISVGTRHYALFGVPKSAWKAEGNTLINEGGAENFISVALLPEKDPKILELFSGYAFNEVTATAVSWSYVEKEAVVETTYAYQTQAVVPGGKEGTLFALYPHQWMNIAGTELLPHEYHSPRGAMKLGGGSAFKTRMKFTGILPVVPSPQRSPEVTKRLGEMLTEAITAKLEDHADTYWAGKAFDPLSLLIPISEQLGNADAKARLLETLQQRLEKWLAAPEAANGKKDHYFTYNKRWGTLVGQKPSYGSEELNDHHFHYGYFIRAAAEVARHNPEWAKEENFGGMINLLVRDIASPERKDALFPFLRCFDPYAGHSWAGGSGVGGSGNNQESISEAINAWTGIYLWGMATGNKTMRDLGAFLYTQEVNACDCYWFDVEQKLFPKEYQRSCAVMIFSGHSAYATWFSAKPEHCHGIILLPIQPGSFYLGLHPEYVKRNLDQVVSLTGNENFEWMDTFCQYAALIDPARGMKWFDAQYAKINPRMRPIAFHWISALQELGQVDAKTTADYPSALVFDKAGKKTYVVYNFTAEPLKVTFSDGTKVDAPKGLTLHN